jgi:hypothetical protein
VFVLDADLFRLPVNSLGVKPPNWRADRHRRAVEGARTREPRTAAANEILRKASAYSA